MYHLYIHRYRQDSNFRYLCGFHEPDAVRRTNKQTSKQANERTNEKIGVAIIGTASFAKGVSQPICSLGDVAAAVVDFFVIR